ncbi:hypothetical protein JNM05_12690 [bacterium]|nr:hypothetical protein [bacterium]
MTRQIETIKMINKILIFFSLILFSCLNLTAQDKPAIQSKNMGSSFLYTDHWAYTYIQLLQDRGYLKDLYYSVKPYKRLDLAKTLVALQIENFNLTEKYWIELLLKEFTTEINILKSTNNNVVSATAKASFGTVNDYRNNHFESDFFVNPEINYSMEHLAVSLRGRIDNGLLNDPTYSGRKTDWIAARLEDGYGSLQFGQLDLFVGRVAHNWAPFLDRSLILSDNPYTYDQIGLNFETKHIAFHSVFAKLNPVVYGAPYANRYFSAHRLDLKFNNGINLGFSETVVYGGPNQPIEFSYMNPFSIFMNAQTNEGKEANENLAFDFFIPLRPLNFKGQILIDDLILDGPDDPAPNRKTSSDRLGFLFAVQGIDFLVQNAHWTLQYENIGSYTYNVKQKRPWQSYTYEGRGLGNEANDRESWSLNFKYFPMPKWIFDLDATYAKLGERNLASNDFDDSTFVKLSFPSGVVEKTVAASLGALYRHNQFIFGQARIGFDNVLNRKHKKNHDKSSAYFLVSIDINIDHVFKEE